MPEARDGYFTTYYAFNKIILDVITVKFNIQVDDRTITQSTLLHDVIPGYNLLTLEFVLPPVNDDEDLILKEENPEIYVHLCIGTYDRYTRHCNFQIPKRLHKK